MASKLPLGEIIETVSSASTELEASRGPRWTSTAARGAGNSPPWLRRLSEEASTNVQSVASATERKWRRPSTEISRQVGRNRRGMAGEAVDQGAQDQRSRSANCRRRPPRIGDVVELINTIAGQTNLLAFERHDRGRASR